MAKVLQQLPAATKASPLKRILDLLSYLHFATLQVPQHYTHHIGRIVQPQTRSLGAALQGEGLRITTVKLARSKIRSGQTQGATP